MIRRAVGALVKKNEKYLLVHKIKVMNVKDGPVDIPGHWDFPKGGIKDSDISNRDAILRELYEETGSNKFQIIKEFEERICFDFPPNVKDFDKQETVMFLIDYFGEESELTPQDEEIDTLEFLSKEEILEKLQFNESRDFFKSHLNQI
ncbi:MAG: NUDIX domain-containing protein [Candidatus Hodarchaeota archaeon]